MFDESVTLKHWTNPPSPPPWPCAQVHIWRIQLDDPPAPLASLVQILSPDEAERASRFYFERDRRRFIVCRAALRTILGSYGGVEPAAVRFCYGPQGKPALLAPTSLTSLQFNVAHSHELALIAVVADRRVGVDIEHIRGLEDADGIASRFFSPAECAALRAIPEERRLWGFFSCWTRKEAYIKARGEGLSIPLDAFTVSLEADARSLLLQGYNDDTDRWRLRPLLVGPDYVAALAVEGFELDLQTWQYRGGNQ
ncbi:MAG: 4'-phosphopantetheinyl transferase [Herpetosiphonaceae bacterium]|nr:MAG: 4'-phosphopantetheinyl transferase [Herpetosiphonaceae bacterium]